MEIGKERAIEIVKVQLIRGDEKDKKRRVMKAKDSFTKGEMVKSIKLCKVIS